MALVFLFENRLKLSLARTQWIFELLFRIPNGTGPSVAFLFVDAIMNPK